MGNKFSFKITAWDKKSKARTGVITTPHGIIETPVFIPVGTKGTVKSMMPADLKKLEIKIFFINTYHLYLNPGADVVNNLGGLHNFISWNQPLITDSGGFQVFSQAKNKKFNGCKLKIMDSEETLCKIDDDGVTFKSHLDGTIHRFTPEISIVIQKKLGADIILCFDECTYYPATYQYAKLAMQRTHSWALRCLKTVQDKQFKKKNYQDLYGIIQGGIYQDLREESARFISSLPFDGIAIGGVAVGESKKEMRNVLDWVTPILPENKPRHLLGVGEVDDIFELVEKGIDSFDCVMPTRLGRMGQALTQVQSVKCKVQKWTIDIAKSKYASDKKPIEESCGCDTCKNFSRAYLNHLFRNHELLAYRLLTYHNLYFITNLVAKIREAIKENRFEKLKKEWLE